MIGNRAVETIFGRYPNIVSSSKEKPFSEECLGTEQLPSEGDAETIPLEVLQQASIMHCPMNAAIPENLLDRSEAE